MRLETSLPGINNKWTCNRSEAGLYGLMMGVSMTVNSNEVIKYL